MQIVIDIHLNARADIQAIALSDKKAASAVIVALEHAATDPNILDKLTTHGDNGVGGLRLGVKQWLSMKRSANLWRFRIFDTPATMYRVIYGYQWQTRQVLILAVVHKEHFNYDDHNSDIVRRIVNDWGNL